MDIIAVCTGNYEMQLIEVWVEYLVSWELTMPPDSTTCKVYLSLICSTNFLLACKMFLVNFSSWFLLIGRIILLFQITALLYTTKWWLRHIDCFEWKCTHPIFISATFFCFFWVGGGGVCVWKDGTRQLYGNLAAKMAQWMLGI